MLTRNAISSLICFSVLAVAASLAARHSPHGSASGDDATAKQAAQTRMAAMPLVFEQNVGQAKGEVRFLARGQGYTLGLNGSETLLSLRSPEESPGRHGDTGNPGTGIGPSEMKSGKQSLLKMRLAGANAKATTVGEKRLKAKINYFIGNDPKQWKTDVPAFEQVRTKDVYPGIDLVHYGQATGALEYDLVVAPGADAGQIRLAFDGAETVRLAENGDLVIKTASGEVRQQKPVCYQTKDEERVPVEGQFVVATGEGAKGIDVRLGEYDSSLELVIDPVLSYSTYLGGSGYEEGRSIATDGAGRAFITGVTDSINFPTLGQFQVDPSDGNEDAFVTVLDTGVTGAASLLYSTYLGGSIVQSGSGIATDGAGRAYVTGYTRSTDFPTKNAYQGDPGDNNANAFVTVLDTGTSGAASLVYSTYLGGASYDFAYGIAADSAGRAFVTGSTGSANFPTQGEYQSDSGNGDQDVFVTVLDTGASGATSLLYSTYLAGTLEERGLGIATDGGGRAFVTGETDSNDFPTLGQFQSEPGDGDNTDVFVTVLNTDATGPASLLYSTYLGGNSVDMGYGIATDGAGRAFVTGRTDSLKFPTKGEYQSDPGDGSADAFVTVLNTSATGAASLLYSTYLGGTLYDQGTGIGTDGSGRAFVTGYTRSTNFPTQSEYQSQPGAGNADAFVTVLDTLVTGAGSLLDSTYLGGADYDQGSGIAVDSFGRAFVTGRTDSTLFPTLGQYQTDQISIDAFVTVFSYGLNAPSGLTATPVSANRINLAWTDNSSDETAFRVERKSGGGNFASIGSYPANTTSGSSTNLTPSTAYTFRVLAVRGQIVSAPSNEADATTFGPVAAPSNLLATVVSSTRITLSWTDNSGDENGFRIERKTGGGSFTVIGSVGTDVTSATCTGLTPSTLYTFRVRAFRGVGYSAYSNERQATTLATLVAPTSLTATAFGSRRINLAWSDNSGDETGYKVERKSGVGSYQLVATLPAGATSFPSTGLTGGVEYTFRVRAYRGSDYSAYTDPAAATANP